MSRRFTLIPVLLCFLLSFVGAGCHVFSNDDEATVIATNDNVVTLKVLDWSSGGPASPLLVAFQDGPTGAWRVASAGSVSGEYRGAVTDNAGAYGFAVVTRAFGSVMLSFVRSTIAESAGALTLVVFTEGGPSSPPSYRTMSGSLDNIPAGMGYYEDSAGSSRIPVGSDYNLGFPDGVPSDLIILLDNLSTDTFDGVMHIRRNFTLATDCTADIDFSGPYGVSTGTWRLTTLADYVAAGADTIWTRFMTANGASIGLNPGGGGASPVKFAVIPEAAMTAGDRYVFGASDASMRKNAMFYSSALGTTVTLPDDFTPAWSVESPTSFGGLATAGSVLYDAAVYYDNSWASGRVTSGWLRAAGLTSISAVPDLSGVAGWDAGWTIGGTLSSSNPASCTRIEYTTTLQHAMRGQMDSIILPAPADNTFIKSVRWTPDT